MTWTAKVGSTLLIPTGSADHLHIVCSDPFEADGYPPGICLLVNVSTVVPKCDATTILRPGDHAFVTRDSFVFYGKARVELGASLEAMVAGGVFRAHDPADQGLVKKIVARMNLSDFVSGEMQQIADAVWERFFA